jgi:diguanylate cyclase (GGDEF)-like protein
MGLVRESSPLPAGDFLGNDQAKQREFAARGAAVFYAGGACLTLLSYVLPGGVTRPAYVGLAAGALLLAAVLELGRRRIPWVALEATVLLGTLLISVGIYLTPGRASDSEVLYLWVAIYAFWFFSRPRACVQVAAIAVGYGGALLLQDAQGAVTRLLVTTGMVLLTGLTVSVVRGWVRELVSRLSDAAVTDPLTGLLNRRAFEELIELELERSRRSGRPLSLLVLDLDRFKEVNDRHGHQSGDAVLQRVSTLLSEAKRRVDRLARVGGEEFAMLAPETDAGAAYVLAERLRAEVRRSFLEHDPQLTVSVGVADAIADAGDAGSLLKKADRALYGAKRLGRDRSVIYSTDLGSMLGESAHGKTTSEVHLATVLTLAEALDIRDTGAALHSRIAGHYAELMALELGLPAAEVERVRLAGVLHDIGQIGIPDSILQKSGPLTDAEWVEMRRHPELGARLLAAPGFDDIREWVLAHHERPDGRGYPRGLKADETPLEARILAVADAYEAMTVDRPYRPAIGEQAAREELRQSAGSQFDPDVVDALLRALASKAHDRVMPLASSGES